MTEVQQVIYDAILDYADEQGVNLAPILLEKIAREVSAVIVARLVSEDMI